MIATGNNAKATQLMWQNILQNHLEDPLSLPKLIEQNLGTS